MRVSKKKTPSERARDTDRWTEILFKALSSRHAKRWRFASFRGAGGGEWRGVVDVLAVRKDTSKSEHQILKSGDLFEMILVQMKGGSAGRPKERDLLRLQAVKRRYQARDIVLFCWNKRKKGKKRKKEGTCSFERLAGGKWVPSSAKEIFG
jgi:hypothetical protein